MMTNAKILLVCVALLAPLGAQQAAMPVIAVISWCQLD